MNRRVDLANFASLFADIEEPAVARGRGLLVARVLALLLVVVLAIGDTVLIARPDAMAHAPGYSSATPVGRVTSL